MGFWNAFWTINEIAWPLYVFIGLIYTIAIASITIYDYTHQTDKW